MPAGAMNQIGVETALAVGAAAVSPTLPTNSNSETMTVSHLLGQVIGQPIRFRADGTAPTATVGTRVEAGGSISFMDPGHDFRGQTKQLQMIAIGAAATIDFTFYD